VQKTLQSTALIRSISETDECLRGSVQVRIASNRRDATRGEGPRTSQAFTSASNAAAKAARSFRRGPLALGGAGAVSPREPFAPTSEKDVA
jgi:hypothetical protein